jgi:probable rRNA maturation factor
MDEASMKDLCLQFKQKKKITDVLSFPVPPMETTLREIETFLGDIAICIHEARKQADKFDHSFLEEIAVLFAHGLFHLLGYDHEKSEEEASIQMQGEMYLLEKIGFLPELSLIGRV